MKMKFCNILSFSTIILYLLFASLQAQSESYTEREMELFKNIRCVVCNSQSIYDSNSENALEIKKFIRNQIANGKTDKEIKNYLVTSFGDDVLFEPPFNFTTFYLWLTPFVSILLGLIIIKSINFKKSKDF